MGRPTTSSPSTHPGRPAAVWRYKGGCRCAECRELWRVYRGPKVREYRARKRAERDAQRAAEAARIERALKLLDAQEAAERG